MLLSVSRLVSSSAAAIDKVYSVVKIYLRSILVLCQIGERDLNKTVVLAALQAKVDLGVHRSYHLGRCSL